MPMQWKSFRPSKSVGPFIRIDFLTALALVWSCGMTGLSGQDFPGQPGAVAPTAGGNPPSGAPMVWSPPAALESETALQVFETLFARESDSVNFEEGTFQWNGQTFNLGDGRIMRSRFVRYLETPSDGINAKVYLSILDEIENRLSVRLRAESEATGDEAWEPIIASWKLLFQAADHPIDGGNSLVLANLVYDNWREREAFNEAGFRRSVSAGELERMADRLGAYGDTMAARTRRNLERSGLERGREVAAADQADLDRAIESASGGGDGGGTDSGDSADGDGSGTGIPGIPGAEDAIAAVPSILPTGSGSALLRDLILEQYETETLGLEMARIGVRAKLKMQSQIVAFMAQRRFDHAILGSAFYRVLFRGGAQDLNVEQSTIQKILPEFELPPTVDQLEFVARQAVDDVGTTMRAVENAFDGNRRIAALERLQEAFFLGEFTQPVVAFPAEKRSVLRDLYYQLRDARRLADLRDYEALESLVDSIEGLAVDFPGAEARAQIRLAKRASEMKLLSAKAALAQNNADLARSELDAAFALWPLNPGLKTFMTDAVAGGALAEAFDRAYAARDFRSVYAQRQVLLPVLAGDPVRSGQMEEALEAVQAANFAIRTAEAQAQQGNYYGAWELLEGMARRFPDDRELNASLTRMTGEVPEYVGLMRKAERMADQGYFAASLNHYLRARDIYPLSTVATEGVNRVAGLILEQVAALEEPETPTESATPE